MYSINSVEDLQELNPYIIVGCGGGGEKFSNLEGIETVGFLDDNPAKLMITLQNKENLSVVLKWHQTYQIYLNLLKQIL